MYRLGFRNEEKYCVEDSRPENQDSVLFTEDKTGAKDNESLFVIDVEGQQEKSENEIVSGDEENVDVCQINSSFWVDTSSSKDKFDNKNEEDDDDEEEEEIDDTDDDSHTRPISDLPVPKFPIIIKPNKVDSKKSSSQSNEKEKNTISWDNTYLDIQLDTKRGNDLNRDARKFCKVDEIMKKSVIVPGYEKLENVPAYNEGIQALRKKRKKERERTKGSKWYDMPATEMTDEIKHDLEVLQMRSVLDPKHFYKKNDLKVLPKYFQVGKVVDNAADFYNSRIPKKQRKRTMVDELLADAEFKRYNKRRYKEIIEERRKTHYKAHIRAKKLKRKK